MPPRSDVTVSAPRTVGGRYLVCSLLGRGGMGEVFLARDHVLDRLVALKLLRPEFNGHPNLRARFEREGRLAAALRHPNICAIHEIGGDGDRPFIAMEYVDGETLHDRVGRGAMRVEEVLEVGLQVASALEEAGRRRVVHRDLKSTNILITRDGVVKILDFGLARFEAEPLERDRLEADHGVLSGTAECMSPEQALGRPVDHRSDLFSLGILLYELLTGRPPFTSGATMEVLWKVVNSEPVPIVGADDRTRALAGIVSRLLQKDRVQRYQSAADVHRDLLVAKEPARAPRRRRLSPASVLRPVAGLAAGVIGTFAGLAPGTVWLCQAAETAWNSAADRRSSVWIGEASGHNMAPVVPAVADADAVWIGNRGSVIYEVGRGRGQLGIWTVPAGRTVPHLLVADGSQPAVTPDGRAVVFRMAGSTAGSAGLYRVDMRGSQMVQLLSGAVASPAIAADGRLVIFERLERGTRSLWSMGIDGGAPRLVSPRSPGSRPIVSPDGRRLAFESDAGVVVCTLPECTDEQLLPIGSPRAWTPDGRALAYIGPPGGANVWIMSVAGGPGRQLTHFDTHTITSLAWSSDGRRLALTRALGFADLTFPVAGAGIRR